MTAMISGEADIGFMGSEASIYTYAAGEKDYAINFAQLTQRAGNFLVGREENPDFQWKDLEGKKVLGGRAGGMPQMVFEYILKKNGLDPKTDLEIDQSISFGLTAAAFTSDDSDYTVEFEPFATGLELDLSETGTLRLKCGLVAQYLVSCRLMVHVVVDAYSPMRDVQVLSETLSVPSLLELREENIFGEQMIPQSAERIVDVEFLPDFPRQHRMGDQVEFVIPGQYQVLYCGEDGSLQSASSRWEGSFRMPADEACRISAVVYPRGRSHGQGNHGQIQLKSEILLGIETQSQEGIPMVEGLELGQRNEPDADRPSLILRRAGDCGLWAIAKKTGTTMDAIREANGLAGEPEEDRILLIPGS